MMRKSCLIIYLIQLVLIQQNQVNIVDAKYNCKLLKESKIIFLFIVLYNLTSDPSQVSQQNSTFSFSVLSADSNSI